MRLSPQLAALFALPTALAVTLSDFTPRVSNLPSACNTVYTQTINGCQPSDFEGSCSRSCVLALNSLTLKVANACANEGITGSNLIVQFLNGNGPSSLCSDADSILGSLNSGSASQAATTSASNAQSTASAPSSTSTTTTTSTTATAASMTSSVLTSTTVTASPEAATSSSSALLADTQTQTTPTPSQNPTSTSGAHRSSQTDMIDSGGGSPFDTEGNDVSGSSTLSAISLATAFITTILALAFALP